MANPLRVAVVIATVWAAGTMILTGLTLAAQVQLTGWQGLIVPAGLLPALACATASYLLRFLRWHALVRRVAPGLSLASSFVVGAIGFALILTPGRSGEALKLVLLRQRTDVPIATSVPVWIVEKICEALGLAILAVGASLFLPWVEAFRTERSIELAGALLLGLLVGLLFWRRIARAAPRLPVLGRLMCRPGINVVWAKLVRGGDQVLSWPVVLAALALSVTARLFDGVAIFWVGRSFGIDLSLAASWFLIGSSGFLGGISMVPGGAGVAEATLVGLLVAFGAPAAAATATALTSRVLILWLWVALGLGLAVRCAATRWPESVEPPDR